MAVHLILQSDAGDVSNANAYIPQSNPLMWTAPPLVGSTSTAPFGFYEYHYDRGNASGAVYDGSGNFVSCLSNGVTYTSDLVASAIIKATDYIDKRFTFVGWRRYSNQPTAWPRWDAVDINDRYLRGIPLAVQQATAEYALRALSLVPLVADPSRDGTGQDVKSQIKKIGPLETATVFMSAFQMPRYPAADAIMRSWGLIIKGGTLVRG